jgi:hypothetical protein
LLSNSTCAATSWLDGGNVYGNDDRTAEWLRADGGESARLLLRDDEWLPLKSTKHGSPCDDKTEQCPWSPGMVGRPDMRGFYVLNTLYLSAKHMILGVQFCEHALLFLAHKRSRPSVLAYALYVSAANGRFLPRNLGNVTIAGDPRANENTLLNAVHTLFARHHNLLVKWINESLGQDHEWTQQQIYDAARQVMAGMQ